MERREGNHLGRAHLEVKRQKKNQSIGGLSPELLRKVRQIEITTRKVVDDILSGQYKSHFKGQGVQFSEHRVYLPGDDVRHIDWKASARSRDPLIKKYDEERQLQVFLVVDLSFSQEFGSAEKLKAEVAAEIGGMLAYAATHTGDRAGLLIFSGAVDHVIPPKKGRQHVLRMIRDLLVYEPQSRGTDLAGALEVAGRVMKHRGVIFIISDFIAGGYEPALKRLARKHDVVAVSVRDDREKLSQGLGYMWLTDPESGEERCVNTDSYAFKEWLESYKTATHAAFQNLLKSTRVELLELETRENYGDAAIRFFRSRSRKRR